MDSKSEKFFEWAITFLELDVECIKSSMSALRQLGPALETGMFCPNFEGAKRKVVYVLHIIALIDRIPSLSSPMALRFHQAVYNLAKKLVCDDGATLLHLACTQMNTRLLDRRLNWIDFTFPSLSVVRLLLKVGANSNVQDHCRRTPLHMLCEAMDINMPIVQALLEGGAHADMYDSNHVSPLNRLGSIRSSGQERAVCPIANTTLKCLAARTIAHSRLLTPDLYKGVLEEDLEQFVDMH